jgi:uncharacterized protein (TIGR00369 family)
MALKWSAEEVFGFVKAEFPQALRDGVNYEVIKLEPEEAHIRLLAGEQQLRPGGTVSGPAMMEMVDFSIYVLLLAHHKEAARLAVTTNLTISFLRKPQPGPIVAQIRLIKHGRTLTVARVDIISEADGKLVASSEATYFMGSV